MHLQPLNGSFITANPCHSTPTYEKPANALANKSQGNLRSFAPPSMRLDATLETEYFSSDTLSIEFTSKDGDKVTFSMESIQYQRAMLTVDAEGSPEDMKKLINYIKKEYSKLRHDILKDFIKEHRGGVDEAEQTPEVGKVSELDIPEYWNAENTSQRIVDYALKFFDAFQGAGQDFVKTIKDAIEKGFKTAKEFFGELDGPIAKLVEDTFELTMKKIDAWASEKGFSGNESAATFAEPERAAA